MVSAQGKFVKYQKGIITEVLNLSSEVVYRLSLRQPSDNRFKVIMENNTYLELIDNDYERFIGKEVTVEVDYSTIKEFVHSDKTERFALANDIKIGWNTKHFMVLDTRLLGERTIQIFCQGLQAIVYEKKSDQDPIFDLIQNLGHRERVNLTINHEMEFNGMNYLSHIERYTPE